MKKLTKVVMGVAALTALSAGAVGLVACGESSATGEAYGLVNGGTYVGYASIAVNGDKVEELTLTEVCFPTQVKTADGGYYAKVTYGNVTATYDETAKEYKVGDVSLSVYLQTEANAKAYYEAVVNNSISAYETADGTANTTAMTYATLSKEENGYWASTMGFGLGWKPNRDATVEYVLANGVENLTNLAKNDDGYWAYGNITTGATWTHLNDKTTYAADGYISYAQLILNAYNAAK